jgi:hypothetical protein
MLPAGNADNEILATLPRLVELQVRAITGTVAPTFTGDVKKHNPRPPQSARTAQTGTHLPITQ